MTHITHIKLSFGLLLGIFTLIYEVQASGIDWQKSIMMVEFTAESAYVPTFSCFGYEDRLTKSGLPTDPGGELNACDGYVGPKDHCVWEYLSELGYDDENTDPDITTCFQQAGDYKASIYLKDFAGNVEGPDINSFANFILFSLIIPLSILAISFSFSEPCISLTFATVFSSENSFSM